MGGFGNWAGGSGWEWENFWFGGLGWNYSIIPLSTDYFAMAVFTKVDSESFAVWARERLGFAHAGAPAPIAEGIENTNYKFRADGRDFVFTIFEVWDISRARYYAALARHLSARGVPAPAPLDSQMPDEWDGKPCVVVPFAPGAWMERPGADALRTMGETAARMHLAAQSFPAAQSMPNPRNAEWRAKAGAEIESELSSDDVEALRAELEADARFSALPLPAAECHCDLFRNNVLWEGGKVSAVIDFYFGGRDFLLFDLAVCCCDWCFNHRAGDFDDAAMAALLSGYRKVRRLEPDEDAALPDALCVAALRFWISRVYDLKFPRAAESLTPHDPEPFRKILRAARARAETPRRRARA